VEPSDLVLLRIFHLIYYLGSSTITVKSLRFAATNVVIRGTSNAQLIITNGLTWNAGFFDVKVVVSGASSVYSQANLW
jgi:hypothetical protein